MPLSQLPPEKLDEFVRQVKLLREEQRERETRLAEGISHAEPSQEEYAWIVADLEEKVEELEQKQAASLTRIKGYTEMRSYNRQDQKTQAERMRVDRQKIKELERLLRAERQKNRHTYGRR